MRTLHYLRLRRGWSQERLGRLLRLNPITVDKLETGQLALYPEAIDHLEQRLGVLFGEQWTYRALMQPVPDLIATPDLEQSA